MHDRLIQYLTSNGLLKGNFPITKELMLEASKAYIALSGTEGKKVKRGDLRYNLKLLALSLVKYKRENKLNVSEGFVYFISNPAWKHKFKVGMSLSPKERLAGYQTYSPMRDYELVHWSFWLDRRAGEKLIHSLYPNREHEWVEISQRKLQKIFTEVNKLSGMEDIIDYVYENLVP